MRCIIPRLLGMNRMILRHSRNSEAAGRQGAKVNVISNSQAKSKDSHNSLLVLSWYTRSVVGKESSFKFRRALLQAESHLHFNLTSISTIVGTDIFRQMSSIPPELHFVVTNWSQKGAVEMSSCIREEVSAEVLLFLYSVTDGTTRGTADGGRHQSPNYALGSDACTSSSEQSMHAWGWRKRSKGQGLLLIDHHVVVRERRRGKRHRRLCNRPSTLCTVDARRRRNSGCGQGSRARICSRGPSMRACGCPGGW